MRGLCHALTRTGKPGAMAFNSTVCLATVASVAQRSLTLNIPGLKLTGVQATMLESARPNPMPIDLQIGDTVLAASCVSLQGMTMYVVLGKPL